MAAALPVFQYLFPVQWQRRHLSCQHYPGRRKMAEGSRGQLSDSKPVILCVDDEPNSLVLRKLVLQKAGYDVITASSAILALDVLASRQVDLVLSDQLMPGLTGTELAHQVKTRWPSLPIILISGVTEIPPNDTIDDLFMSKVEGPVLMCQNINYVLVKFTPLRSYSCLCFCRKV
jgi:CheY-like chemotaxis protein